MPSVPQAQHERSVTFLSEDSVHVRGTYWEPRDDRAISLVLIHDAGAEQSVWDPFVPLFRTRGWGVLTFDLRGHGGSVRQDMRADLLRPSDDDLTSPHAYPLDVKAALQFVVRQPKADPAKVALIGAGIGADLAYAAAGRGWGNASTVCIGLDEARGRSLAGPGAFAPRSIYLLHGALDPVSTASADAFLATCAYPAEVQAYTDSAERGIALFTAQQPEIVARAIMWIERTI